MKKLLKGIVDFRQRIRPTVRETFAKLALGQSPDSLLIACSDSRVAPNLFASTEPGDMFVIRNVGNIIAPCGPEGRSESDESEAAAIEFATMALKVRDIILCGHSDCGAMRGLIDPSTAPSAPHLHDWLRHARPALDQLRQGRRLGTALADHNVLSQLNVLRQLEHLKTYPAVRERLDSGFIRLHGWWFDIAEAELLAWEESQGRFVIIDEGESERILARLGT